MTVSRHSADWMAIKRMNLEQIELHRLELESLTVAPDRGQQLRGMIAALRIQIDTVEPREDPIPKEVNYG